MSDIPSPITRKDQYLSYLTGNTDYYPTDPITREEKYLFYLCENGGIGGGGEPVSPEEIESAVNKYLTENPVQPGATVEQAAQIEQNKTDISELSQDILKLKSVGECASVLDFSKNEFVQRTGKYVSIAYANQFKAILSSKGGNNRLFYGWKLNLIRGRVYRVKYSFSIENEDTTNNVSINSNSELGSESIVVIAEDNTKRTGTLIFTAVEENYLRFSIYGSSQKEVSCIIEDITDEINDVTNKITDVINKSVYRPWNEKTWLAWGDSITAISNGNGLDIGWAKYTNEIIPFSNFYGRGVGGQTFMWNTVDCQVNLETGEYISRGTDQDNCKGCFCSWDRISKMIPDSIKDSISLIWIMGGTNDLSNVEETTGQSVIEYTKPKFIQDEGHDSEWVESSEYLGGDFDLLTFSGCIASTIMKLQIRCPNARIILSAPLPRWWTPTVQPVEGSLADPVDEEYMQQEYRNGKTILDVADVEEKVAKYMGVPFFNLTEECGINGFNYETYMEDAVHPYKTAGQKLLGRNVAQGINRVYPNQ